MTDSLEISVSHIDVDELFNHSSCKNVEYRNKSINMCDKQVCIRPSTAAGNVTLPAAVRRAAVDRYHPPAGSTEAAGLLLLLLWAHVGTDGRPTHAQTLLRMLRGQYQQEAQLSPRDRAVRRVN